MKTNTGNIPIGWRNRRLPWEESIPQVIDFALQHELEVVDLQALDLSELKQVTDAGIKIGSIDLPEVFGMISKDKSTRDEAIAKNSACVRELSEIGVSHYFVCMLPEDQELPRSENFKYMVDSYNQLAEVLQANNADVVIEGWPGRGCLVTTPETYGSLFEQTPECIGVNYDPSHLVRMGIDPLRFLKEFIDRVHHMHGKDTMIVAENQYRYGTELPAAHAQNFAFGGLHWRYTIPGHGLTDWIKVFEILDEAKYQGAVCIELEDAYFNDSDALQKKGVIEGARFLSNC